MAKINKTSNISVSKNLIWKWLANLWAILTILLYLVDFFSGNKYNASAGATSVIYISLLGLYAGSKEFDRWTSTHRSISFGEIFIVLWTALMVMMAVLAPFSQGKLTVPSEAITTYIAVLGVFAITQKSKNLNTKRRK